jgi:uncharacterized protein (TIGR03435 family)
VTKHLLGVAVFAAFSIGTAQDLTSKGPRGRPEFVVASIKECNPTDQTANSTSLPGRLSLICWPLWRLIADAYETFATGETEPLNLLVPLPLEGAPAWVNSARYSINAKAEGPQSGAMMRGPLMQALLENRFQLKTHRDTREVPAYILTVAKGGAKLRPTEEGSCNRVDPADLARSPKVMPGGKPWCLAPTITRKGSFTLFDLPGATLGVFSKFVHPDGRPVIDRTGLTGVFDFHLEWETDSDGGATNDDPSPHMSVIVAIREQLGLRLDPGKGPREFLIIDHVEKASQN